MTGSRINKPFMLGTALLLAFSLQADAQIIPEKKKTEPQPCGPRVLIEYTDDDPDYFIIKNRSAKGWSLAMLAIELSPSAGNLVFDTDEGGPGVGGASGFDPDVTGPVKLVGTVPAQDGGRTMALHFAEFTEGRDYTFHVDLDALPGSGGRTWVLPQDVKGARALATFEGPSGQKDKVDAFFDDKAEADSGAGGCV